jgi:hypothetical protein
MIDRLDGQTTIEEKQKKAENFLFFFPHGIASG